MDKIPSERGLCIYKDNSNIQSDIMKGYKNNQKSLVKELIHYHTE